MTISKIEHYNNTTLERISPRQMLLLIDIASTLHYNKTWETSLQDALKELDSTQQWLVKAEHRERVKECIESIEKNNSYILERINELALDRTVYLESICTDLRHKLNL